MPIDHPAPVRDRDPIAGYLIADTHFPERPDRGPWSGVSGVYGDALFALEQISHLCADDGADLYLAGDVFDGPDPGPEALTAVYGALRPLIDAGLSIYYILGNHDRDRDWLRPLGTAAVRVDGVTVKTKLGTVTGLSYVHPDSFPEVAKSMPATDVGLYHQTWNELVKVGRSSMRLLPRHKIALCGDVHIRRTFELAPHGPDLAISPGPLAPQSVTEFAPLAAVYGLTESLKLVEVPLFARRFVTTTASTPAEFAHVLATLAALQPDPGLPPHLASPFVSVRLTGAPPEIEAEVRAAADRAGVVVRIDHGRSQPKTKSEVTPTGSIELAVEASSISAPAKDLCRAVLSARDPGTVLMNHRLACERTTRATDLDHPH